MWRNSDGELGATRDGRVYVYVGRRGGEDVRLMLQQCGGRGVEEGAPDN